MLISLGGQSIPRYSILFASDLSYNITTCNSSVILHCPFHINQTKVEKLSWYFGFTPIVQKEFSNLKKLMPNSRLNIFNNEYSIFENNSLLIKSVKGPHSGNYKCVLESNYDSAISHSTSLLLACEYVI